jgi:hypothetical protein
MIHGQHLPRRGARGLIALPKGTADTASGNLSFFFGICIVARNMYVITRQTTMRLG